LSSVGRAQDSRSEGPGFESWSHQKQLKILLQTMRSKTMQL